MTKLIIAIMIGIFPSMEYQEGKASYYGEGNWHGSVMANGEQFDPYEKVCAHRQLPFGTKLAIVNKNNNRMAFCIVKDRGPFDIVDNKPVVDLNSKYERVLDTSIAVANELRMREEGIVNVSIFVLEKSWYGSRKGE